MLLVTKYSKMNVRERSFIGSDMSNQLPNSRSLLYFNSNITAMGGCQKGRRRDVGLVSPKGMLSGYEDVLKKEMSKHLKFITL